MARRNRRTIIQHAVGARDNFVLYKTVNRARSALDIAGHEDGSVTLFDEITYGETK
jgi:hypothetical protein